MHVKILNNMMIKRMKTIYGFVFCLVGCLSVSHVQAQGDMDELLEGGVADGEKLLGGYVSPFMKVLSSSMNQGWYNTAKPHKVAGFDLTVTVNAMSIPSSEKFYNIPNLGLTEVELSTPQPAGITNGNVPTLFGSDVEPVYQLRADPSQKFSGPPGINLKKEIGMNSLPIPMVHLGFGLPKGFEIKFRYTPKIDIGDDGTAQLLGFGVMHDIKQHIPGIKLLAFDLSAFVGYTNMKLDYDLGGNVTGNGVDEQRGVFTINATTIQGIISKKISVLTVYGALGYNIAKSKLAIKGAYDFNEDGDFTDTREKDPINLDNSASGPRVTGGFRLKLAVFTLHADYTLQKFSCLSAGFGINVR
jgi:hypothetical protein